MLQALLDRFPSCWNTSLHILLISGSVVTVTIKAGDTREEEPVDDVKDKVLCVAQSLPRDIDPASRLGLKTVVDRRGSVTCNEVRERGLRVWRRWQMRWSGRK